MGRELYKWHTQYIYIPEAKTGYVKEGFLVEIPEWGGIGQLKKNEAYQERG